MHRFAWHISIHAPPRGATRNGGRRRGGNFHFNSRPSARGDTGKHADLIVCDISIHAPPRGATLRSGATQRRQFNFNSRPSARGDFLLDLKAFRFPYFNSRPSARGDLVGSQIAALAVLFQFTPLREGRRLEHARAVVVLIISIHAPPRGATVLMSAMEQSLTFQFTPLREGRQHGGADRPTQHHFNSRPSARGDALPRRE